MHNYYFYYENYPHRDLIVFTLVHLSNRKNQSNRLAFIFFFLPPHFTLESIIDIIIIMTTGAAVAEQRSVIGFAITMNDNLSVKSEE